MPGQYPPPNKYSIFDTFTISDSSRRKIKGDSHQNWGRWAGWAKLGNVLKISDIEGQLLIGQAKLASKPPEGFDWVEPGGAAGGVDAEDQADGQRDGGGDEE